MARRPDSEIFVDCVRRSGGRIGNKSLRDTLGWSEDRYWRAHKIAFDSGRVEKGRGYGGSVILVDDKNPVAAADVAAVDAKESALEAEVTAVPPHDIRELHLYPSVLKQLTDHWATRRGLQSCVVEVTAQQGRWPDPVGWSGFSLNA